MFMRTMLQCWHSIKVLTRLEELDLSDCPNLTTLPDTLGLLTRLQRLDVNDCANLEALPSTLGQLTKLRRVTRPDAQASVSTLLLSCSVSNIRMPWSLQDASVHQLQGRKEHASVTWRVAESGGMRVTWS